MAAGTVLVVDDVAANTRLLEAILSPRGYRVVTAGSGPEALAMIDADDVDLVLLDIQMPGMNGYEVCRRIRDDDRHALLPVVMITAAGNEEKVNALEAGADDFVLRPFDQAELLARVRSLLRIKTFHDTVQGQAAELAAWNRMLEDQVREQVDELERLRRLRRFLSPQIADAVLTTGDESILAPHRREVAVLFCDLRGFTAFSASCEPEEALAALEGFHRSFGELVARHGATVGFFAGDGVMVFFNDPMPCPDPALRAVSMALDVRDAMREHAEEWSRRGYRLGIGAGISLGFATLGTLGFEGRYDYSAIGPVVNQASRMCDEAADGEILVGQRAFAAVEEAVEADARGELALRSFPEPVRAWSVTGLKRRPPRVGTTPAPDLPPLDFRILGPLEVRAGDREVDITASKERALLTLLLVDHDQVVSVERLADDLWDGDPPDSAVPALRVHVSRLRKTLATAGIDSILVTRPPGYLLRVDADAIDAVRFAREAAVGHDQLAGGDADAAVTTLRGALALWRGPALAEVASSPFARAEAARFEELRLVAIEDCIDAELARGRHRQVIGELEGLVVAHPLRERLWAQRMVALHRAGRQPDALRVYQELRTRLGEELGLEPSPELVNLERAIVARSPELEWSPAAGRRGGEGGI